VLAGTIANYAGVSLPPRLIKPRLGISGHFGKPFLFGLTLRRLSGAKQSQLRGPEGPALRHIQEELVVITRLSWGHIWGQAEKLLNI